MNNSTCRLCGEKKELKRSHAIPSAFFKQAMGDTGQAFYFDVMTKLTPKKDGNIIKGHLLCNDCEHLLNDNYEKFIINLLKNGSLQRKKSTVKETSNGNVLHFKDNDLNANHLVVFILSVLWRASHLKIDFYKDTNLPPFFLDWIKGIMLSNGKPKSNQIGIEINTLIDSSNKIPAENLKEIITSPFRIAEKPRATVAMIFGGYLFKIIMPNKKISERKNQISLKTSIYLCRNCELYSIPAISRALELEQ